MCQFATSQFDASPCAVCWLIGVDGRSVRWSAARDKRSGHFVRFDDVITTILRQPLDTSAARSAVWQQLLDRLAQLPPGTDENIARSAWEQAEILRADVPLATRRRFAETLAPFCTSASLVRHFADDLPSVAAPLLLQAQISAEDWADILFHLPIAARALLRERRDLPQATQIALQSYGAEDFILPDHSANSAPVEPAPDECFEAGSNPDGLPVLSPAAHGAEFKSEGNKIVRRFRLLTDANGWIIAASGAPASAVIGMDIWRMAEPGGTGVDGYAAGAFRARAEYRNARLFISGRGPVAGEWFLTALPRFSEETGVFLGYVGSCRRPRRSERFRRGGSAQADSATLPDGLRHFLHEVRTPLNAIRGFSEIIAVQLNGPVNAAYRAHAQSVVAEASLVSEILDDLNLYGRLGDDDFEDHPVEPLALGPFLAGLVADLHASLRPEQRGLMLRAEPDLPLIWGDAALVQHMLRRFLEAILSMVPPATRLDTRLVARGGDVLLSVARPDALKGFDDASLFGARQSNDGADMRLLPLGLAFALRLVRGLADLLGVRLELSRQSFTLRFPGESSAADATIY